MKTFSEKINWSKSQEWFQKMERCEQNPRWHKEGNVMIHTLMVCDQLEKIPEYKDLSDEDQETLQWAALLHDSGKPFCTSVENGQIVVDNHSAKGVFIARDVLAQIGLPLKNRENVCNLIRWHMFPPRIERADDPAYHVIFTSCLCKNNLLEILSKADINGRYGEGQENCLFWINEWKEHCIKFNCFVHPYHFQNSEARVVFYEKQCFQPYYVPHMEDKFEVIMLVGLPGVGKTTFANTFLSKYPLLELDMIREEEGLAPLKNEGKVQQLAKERCRKFLRKKTPFVFGAVNHLKKTRNRWIGLFRGYGAKVTIAYMEKPFDVILKQNASRESGKVVPEFVIRNMFSILEVPNWDECNELVFITGEKA